MNRSAQRTIVILSALGLAVSIGLEVLHIQAYLQPTADSFCSMGGPLDCTSVALSRWSVIWGVPLPVAGAIGFAMSLWASLRRWGLVLPLALFSAIASIVLLAVEIVAIGSICMFCEVVHVIAVALAIVAWRSRDIEATKATLSPGPLALDLLVPGAALVATALFAPPYWSLASWQSGTRLPHGVDESNHLWIGAETPVVSVEEWVDFACPHCAVGAAYMRMFVAQHKDTVRVIRRHQPRMHCNLSEKIDRADTTPRCRFVRASLCASDLGKGWEMDDWMFAHAREGDDIDLVAAAEEIGMDGTAFGSCLRDPAAFDRAQAEVDAAKAAKIRATPMYVIDGETMDHPTAIETLRARL